MEACRFFWHFMEVCRIFSYAYPPYWNLNDSSTYKYNCFIPGMSLGIKLLVWCLWFMTIFLWLTTKNIECFSKSFPFKTLFSKPNFPFKLHRTGGESLQPWFGLKKVRDWAIKKVRVWAIVFNSKKVRDWAKKVRDWAPTHHLPGTAVMYFWVN